MHDRRRPTVPLNVVLDYNLTEIRWFYLVLSTDDEEANGAGDLGVIKDLVTFHIPD